MKYKIVPWAPIYSHVTQKTLIDNVANQHLSQFPDHMFKNRWLDDKRSIQNLFKDNKFINDIKLPSVTVSYETDDDPKNTLEQGDWPYTYASHFIAGNLKTFYWKIYKDPITKSEIYMAPVRMKITLTFKYLFPDINTRDDVYRWMLMNFRYSGPPTTYGLHNDVYAPIPNVMLNYLANVKGANISDQQNLNVFNLDLMQNSNKRLILRKTNAADKKSSRMMFLKYEMPHMQIIQIQKPEKEDGELKGQTKTNFGITEVLEFEPYVPQMFITRIPEMVNGMITPDTYKQVSVSNLGVDDRLFKTRNYTKDPVSKYLHGVKDLTVISNMEFTIDHNGEETIDIDTEIYGPMHLDIKNILLSRKEDPNQFYQIYLFVYDTKLTQGVDYTVNWETNLITIKNSIPNGNYKLVSCARRRELEPYMRNYLIHNPDEYNKLFPPKKVKEPYQKKFNGSMVSYDAAGKDEGDNYVE